MVDDALKRSAVRTSAFFRLAPLLLILVLVTVFARVVQLKIAPNAKLAAAVGSPMSSRTEMARRGDLVDRHGRIISTSTVGYRLFIDPQLVTDPNTIAVDLSMLLEIDPIGIDRHIQPSLHKRYVVISPLLDDWQVDAIRAADMPGVGLEMRQVRQQPNGLLGASLVGLVGTEHTGLSGAEYKFQKQLAGANGKLTYLRDARRRALWIEPNGYNPSSDGEDIQITIDLVLQQFAQNRLEEEVRKRGAAGGRIVLADCTTGDILASYAVLDPPEHRKDIQREKPVHPALMRNRCVTDPYEPGSTFKPFVWATATSLGRADPKEMLKTPTSTGYRTDTGRLIRDAHYYGPSNWTKVLIKSMNSGMAIVAQRMTFKEMQGTVARFGFGRITRCGFSGESAGLITKQKNWNQYTQVSVAMGHEIAVTPVQMVRAFMAIARDGTMPQLRLTPSKESEAGMLDRALPAWAALETRQVLERVMTEGTGRRAVSERYRLFGKSGTAQLPKPKGGGYFEDRYVSSFIAGAPASNPRLVAICVIDDPQRSKGYYGGTVAGPVVRDVLDHALSYLGVLPDQPHAAEQNKPHVTAQAVRASLSNP